MGGEGAGGKEGVERGQVRRRGRSGEGAGGREGWRRGRKNGRGGEGTGGGTCVWTVLFCYCLGSLLYSTVSSHRLACLR